MLEGNRFIVLSVVVCVLFIALGICVFIRIEKAKGPDPLRPLPLALRQRIVDEVIDWKRRHSGWSDEKNTCASYGGDFAVMPGVAYEDKRTFRYVKILDASGQPIFYEEASIDYCNGSSWAVGWDEEDRLWLLCETGPARYWVQNNDGEWMAKPYEAGSFPSPPEFD